MPDDKPLSKDEALDPAKRAEADLSEATEHVSDAEGIVVVGENVRELQEKQQQKEQQKEYEEAIATEATEEREAAPVLEYTSTRNDARILLVTSDPLVYQQGSEAQLRILEMEKMFAEVHVIVLEGTTAKHKKPERISQTVWIYASSARFWWLTAFSAKRVAKKQLSFAEGFRADLVIADDPFEAGWAGSMIAKKYKRPFQVHVRVDYFDPSFKKRAKHNAWRIRMAKRVMKRTSCVRTSSEYLRRRTMEAYGLDEVQAQVLPVYYDIEAWKNAVPSMSLKQKYPQFKFTLLHVSTMNRLSYTAAIIDGLFYILRQYPTIGLVIVGDGPDREDLQERVARYQLERQIAFESRSNIDVLSYIKTADALIHTSEETSQDQIILQAAVAEVPIVCGNYGIASQLFVNEESVLLCPVDSPPCFGSKVNELLNDNLLRRKLTMAAQSEVLERIEQDYGAYMNAYRSSIEQCLVIGEAEAKEGSAAENTQNEPHQA